MVTLLERRRAVAFDNIPSVRISRFSRHFLATRETIFEGYDSKPLKVAETAQGRTLQYEEERSHPRMIGAKKLCQSGA